MYIIRDKLLPYTYVYENGPLFTQDENNQKYLQNIFYDKRYRHEELWYTFYNMFVKNCSYVNTMICIPPPRKIIFSIHRKYYLYVLAYWKRRHRYHRGNKNIFDRSPNVNKTRFVFERSKNYRIVVTHTISFVISFTLQIFEYRLLGQR